MVYLGIKRTYTQTRLKQKCNLDTNVAVKLTFEVSVPIGYAEA
jgi:hypothetical protein